MNAIHNDEIRSVTHKVDGKPYHLHGANADLWDVATRFKHLTGDLDLLAAAFASEDDNDRMSASKKLITKLWCSHRELGPYPFLHCLSKFEFERVFYHKY